MQQSELRVKIRKEGEEVVYKVFAVSVIEG
jgi:hypothetical protein